MKHMDQYYRYSYQLSSILRINSILFDEWFGNSSVIINLTVCCSPEKVNNVMSPTQIYVMLLITPSFA